MTTRVPSARLSLKSGLRSSFKRPAPLNPDDLEPLLSASLKVRFSPFPQSPLRSAPRSVHSPTSNDPTKIVTAPSSAPISPWRLDQESEIGDFGKLEEVQYAFETTKLPADVPTATFDYPMPSKFSSSESSASDSDDSSLDDMPTRQRSVRFAPDVPHSPIPHARTQEEIDRALSFLPGPLSPYPPSFKRTPRLKTKYNRSPAAKLTIPVAPAQPGGGAKRKSIRRPAQLFIGEPDELDVPRFAPPGLIGQPKLSPVIEFPDPDTPSITIEYPSSDERTDSTTSTLSTAFWSSVSVQQSPGEQNGSMDSHPSQPSPAGPKSSLGSVNVPPLAIPSPAFFSPQPSSPYPLFLFGRSDGTFWSPEAPRQRVRTSQPDYVGKRFPLSPATTAFAAKTFQTMTSPAPNDRSSSFPSLASALDRIDVDGLIAFPPGVELRDPPSPQATMN